MKIDLNYIKTEAEELIDKYALTVPVHVFELADLMGIKWKTTSTTLLKKTLLKEQPKSEEIIRDWDDILGYFNTSKELILLNDEHHPITRKRFTMAHEIGHVYLHHKMNTFHRTVFMRQDIVAPHDDTEAEANYFAGYLLMPDKEMKNWLKYTELMTSANQIVKSMSKLFAVSSEAMRVRLKTFKKEHPEVWNEYNLNEKIF